MRALSTREESAYEFESHKAFCGSFVALKADDFFAFGTFDKDLSVVSVFVFFVRRIKIIFPDLPELFVVVGASQFLHHCSSERFFVCCSLIYGHRIFPSSCSRGGYMSGILQGNDSVGAM